MIRDIWNWVRQTPLVRYPLKAVTSAKRLPLIQPAPIVVSLEELAPVWLRHNHDFRPAQGEVGRTMTAPAMTMTEALAPAVRVAPPPIASSSAVAPNREQPPPVMPSVAATKRVQSSALVRDFIVPYQGILETQGVLAPILRMVDVLEEYGQCPSVVLEAKTQDEEAGDLVSIRDTLAQVTLRDHTHRVTKHGIEGLLATYKDPEPLIPKMLVACLGHDFGKIPSFRASGIYSMRDHPAISVVKVRELFGGHDVFWLDEVCQVIQSHHRFVKDGFATLLKQADGQAREEEVAMVSQSYEIKRWDDWFAVPLFLGLVEPLINVAPGNGRTAAARNAEWAGFTHKGVVYCQTTVLYRVVKDLAKQLKVVDIHLLRQSDREHVMRTLAASLQKAGVLADTIGEGYYGRKYTVRLRNKKQLGVYCLPIVEAAFQAKPSELEQRKSGFFGFIDDVVKD
ncbi:MAG: HD domain-containing protein [Nitrospirae bacterium]|nr:HD domain-containing protein [Nitrospirota bacterium]MDE3041660.1 HD domain-containing protein [Nitrospirota bacterium]